MDAGVQDEMEKGAWESTWASQAQGSGPEGPRSRQDQAEATKVTMQRHGEVLEMDSREGSELPEAVMPPPVSLWVSLVLLRHHHEGTCTMPSEGALGSSRAGSAWLQTLVVFAGKHWRREEDREEPPDDWKEPAWQECRQLLFCLQGEKSRRMSTMHKGPMGRSCHRRMGSVMLKRKS